MSRRGENIYKRKDSRWEGRYIESYSAEGKARYRSVYAHTYGEVKAKLRRRQPSVKRAHSGISVTDWTAHYLELHRPKIKLSTAKVYDRYLNKYIAPFFKSTALSKVSRELLQSFINSLSGLSASTVKGVFALLRESLKLACKQNYITSVWVGTELPKPKRRGAKAFTRSEQSLIENTLDIDGHPNDIGILLCLYTGLRIGEACGLKWEDIDLTGQTLTINRTVQRITLDGKSVLKEFPPKSVSSRRCIPIPSFLAELLREAKKRSNTEYILSTNGHAEDPRSFQYRYKKILKTAGVKYASAHTLRHTFSVRALESGFDIKTLSEILVHSDAVVTMKTYAHSLDEHKRTSMERLGKLRNTNDITRQNNGNNGADTAP